MIFILVPDWLLSINALWLALGILILLGISIVVLLARRKDETLLIEQKHSEASSRLLKTTETELEQTKKKKEQLEEEIEQVTAEYRAVVAIDIQKLLEYWLIRENELAMLVKLRAENRILRKAAGVGEDEDVIHKTNG